MFNLGPSEIFLILIVVVFLFGSRKLPELGSGLAEAIKNFKKGYRESKAIDVSDAEDDSASRPGARLSSHPGGQADPQAGQSCGVRNCSDETKSR